MSRLRPGWLVALCAAILVVSAWLPWLTADGARASAVGAVYLLRRNIAVSSITLRESSCTSSAFHGSSFLVFVRFCASRYSARSIACCSLRRRLGITVYSL